MHNIKAFVAQELKHLLKHTVPLQVASLAQRLWCVIKAQKKIFQSQGALASYLERHELLCLCSLLDVANHT